MRQLIALYRKGMAAAGDDRQLQRQAAAVKRRLPALCFQATFTATLSKSGRMDTWRKQGAAVLNGLYVADIDHIPDPRALWEQCRERALGAGTVLAFVTASGHGLKLVAKADAGRGNLIDNAHWLAGLLGVETDESCKDASRLSFCPAEDDILFIDQEIFTYEDPEFEKKYGDSYRGGRSAALVCDGGHGLCAGGAHTDSGHGGAQAVREPAAADGKDRAAAAAHHTETPVTLDKDEDGNYTYQGAKYADIVDRLAAQRGGYPAAGGRHLFLLQLAGDLRYICDNQPHHVSAVLMLCRTAQEVAAERGTREIEDIAHAACSRAMLHYLPKRLRTTLESMGLHTSQPEADGEAGPRAIDYEGWWQRLQPLLGVGFADAVAPLPDRVKMGGVLAAGAMFGSYLTRCWWQHYDGEQRRLSYLVYIVGDAASGKSFIIEMDRLIMACMRYKDQVGRDWERQYKEDKQRRATSRKNQGEAAQEIKHPVIRYVPSTISNAKFYQRSMDAAEEVDGQEMHLHLYTMESELSTALRAQVGSWAGKLDLECKSFQNEYAGVDYANEMSVNGVIQVNWNQVVSGTMDAMRRKITSATVLDGLVTRLALFMMPSSDYTMISKVTRRRDMEREHRLRAWGYRLDELSGELPCERLVDAAYDWCNEQAQMAAEEDDRIRDYFRKRVPLYMVRYGLVRAVLREYDEFKKTGKLNINDDDVAFARLMGDFIIYMQIYLYGNQVEQAMETVQRDFTPRQRRSKLVDHYKQLPTDFENSDLVAIGYTRNSAKSILSRLCTKGIIKRLSNGKYRKMVDSIEEMSVR